MENSTEQKEPSKRKIGRPLKYKTEEERHAAILENQRRYFNKIREAFNASKQEQGGEKTPVDRRKRYNTDEERIAAIKDSQRRYLDKKIEAYAELREKREAAKNCTNIKIPAK